MIGMQFFDINKSLCVFSIMASNKRIFWEDLFAPLDLSSVYLGNICLATCTHHVPKFNGNSWLDSRNIAYFMDYVVENNIVYKNVLMKAFAFSKQGKDAWDWYCSLKPKEIKSFPQ